MWEYIWGGILIICCPFENFDTLISPSLLSTLVSAMTIYARKLNYTHRKAVWRMSLTQGESNTNVPPTDHHLNIFISGVRFGGAGLPFHPRQTMDLVTQWVNNAPPPVIIHHCSSLPMASIFGVPSPSPSPPPHPLSSATSCKLSECHPPSNLTCLHTLRLLCCLSPHLQENRGRYWLLGGAVVG